MSRYNGSFRAIPFYRSQRGPKEIIWAFWKAPLVAQRIVQEELRSRARLEQKPDGYWVVHPDEWNAIVNSLSSGR